MNEKKFDPKKLRKLNNPERLIDIPPAFIKDQLAGSSPDVMLEIGAGTAFFSIALRNTFHPSVLYACDISPTMIDWMTENVVPNYPDIKPLASTETGVPLPDEIAGLLFMINLHHELDAPEKSIAESYRLLRPAGDILIIDWKKQDMDDGPPQHIRCEAETVADQLRVGGFSSIKIINDLPKHFMVTAKRNL